MYEEDGPGSLVRYEGNGTGSLITCELEDPGSLATCEEDEPGSLVRCEVDVLCLLSWRIANTRGDGPGSGSSGVEL